MKYRELPKCPNEVTAVGVIIRMVDGIMSRYANATYEIPENLSDYKVTPSAMNLKQVHLHIFNLMKWSCKSFEIDLPPTSTLDQLSDFRSATIDLCLILTDRLSKMSDQDLNRVTVYLKRTDTYLPFWFLINGPLADVLTHIGQINSWRRAAGYPCPSYSPLLGKEM